MGLELINGAATATANEDASEFFAGTISPRRYSVSESLLDQAHAFLEAMFAGRKTQHQIAEAFSTSDFTLAVFAAIDTQIQQVMDELPAKWREYTDVMTVPDFRPTRLLTKWFDTLGLKLVPELTEYPIIGGQDHSVNWINVAKYGGRDAFSWESQINNTLIDEFQAAPTKYGNAAAEAEAINALANLLNIDPKTNTASGFNTGFFKAGNNNAPDTRKLNAENLDNVLDEMTRRIPSNRKRLVTPPDFLAVIPKALERQMKRILNLREIRRAETNSGTTDTQVFDNYLATVDYVVEPMLDTVLTSASKATSWFVLPKTGSRQPASFAAFLRGHEAPDMRYKSTSGQRIGGGDVSPLDGSFEIDDIQTRVRHILGHQVGDPTFTYVSDGTAS